MLINLHELDFLQTENPEPQASRRDTDPVSNFFLTNYSDLYLKVFTFYLKKPLRSFEIF